MFILGQAKERDDKRVRERTVIMARERHSVSKDTLEKSCIREQTLKG